MQGFNNCVMVSSLSAFTKIKLQFMNSYYSGKVAPTVAVKKVNVSSSVNDCLTILSLVGEGFFTSFSSYSIVVSFWFGCVCLYPMYEIDPR